MSYSLQTNIVIYRNDKELFRYASINVPRLREDVIFESGGNLITGEIFKIVHEVDTGQIQIHIR